MATSPQNIAVAGLLTRFATDIAFVTGDQPATNLADFAEQVSTAAERLESTGITGADALDDASAALAAAGTTSSSDQAAHLRHAARSLQDTADMVGEYRLMV
ncbi:hypothetical protein RB201_04355 [Streptomyces sp. S1A(2023)]